MRHGHFWGIFLGRFLLDNHPAWEQPLGECRCNGLRKSKRGKGQATLNNQERGEDWEYLVIAVNKAGGGVASNTVTAVLRQGAQQ